MGAKVALGAFPLADRLVFLLFIILMAIPILRPIGLPIPVTDVTRKSFKLMDSLKQGDVLVMCFEQDMGTYYSGAPPDEAGLKHAFLLAKQRGVKVILFGTSTAGSKVYIDAVLIDTEEFWKPLKYGEDWVNFGWLPGFETAMAGFARDVQGTCKVDVNGKRVEELPMMKNIKTLNDITGIWYSTNTNPDMLPRQWSPLEWKGLKWSICQTLFASVPWIMPYVDKGSITSYVADQRGAGEYEMLLGKLGMGATFMDAQSIGHLYGIALIIIANIYYLYTRATKKSASKEK